MIKRDAANKAQLAGESPGPRWEGGENCSYLDGHPDGQQKHTWMGTPRKTHWIGRYLWPRIWWISGGDGVR